MRGEATPDFVQSSLQDLIQNVTIKDSITIPKMYLDSPFLQKNKDKKFIAYFQKVVLNKSME